MPTLPAGWRVRAATAEDRPALARTLAAAFTDASWTPARVSTALFEDPTVRQTLVVATADGGIAATASARRTEAYPDAGYVHWVGSDPACAGRGAGAAVLIGVLQAFQDMGLDAAVLETDAHRLPALRLYRRLGFRAVPRDPEDPARWAQVAAQLGWPADDL